MLTPDRHRAIIAMLNENQSLKSKDLSIKFQVSMETIRRDMAYLEKQGFLVRVHGGVTLGSKDLSHPFFDTRIQHHLSEKEYIAGLIPQFIQEGMSIAIDAGTTNLVIAKTLKERFSQLTIITNSLAIANELVSAKNFQIILPGGTLNHEELSLSGEICNTTIQKHHVDLFLLSCYGVSLHAGVTDFDAGEVAAKHAFVQSAQKTILSCTSDRFDVISLINVCDLSSIDCIVTDQLLSPTIANRYQEAGVTLVQTIV